MLPSLRRLQLRGGWRAFAAAAAETKAGTGPASAAAAAAAGEVQWSPGRARVAKFIGLGMPAGMLGLLAYAWMFPDDDFYDRVPGSAHQVPVKGEEVVNWSGTHTVQPSRYYQPESPEDVEAIVADCHAAKRRLRVVGSALSPNGIGFSQEGMMSMALLDKVVRVDAAAKQVTVQAGCRVQQVADYLKPYGLTLQNYASIREQQIGGYTQVSAHGTGAAIPPVDEQVVSMKVVTPGKGTLTLSRAQQPALFDLARVGLGALGVVTEMTLQCVPLHHLVERSFVASSAEVERNHTKWLRQNQHLRYMWLPYTDKVVVVQCNPASARAAAAAAASKPRYSRDEQLAPLRQLLASSAKASAGVGDVSELTATQLRDQLLVVNPLDKDWVAKVNQAEAEYWSRAAGVRAGTSDEILGFDCGGQQWVLEVSFPIGSLRNLGGGGWFSKPQHKDLAYMKQLLQDIEAADIPAHSPIEQRWTSSSSAPMSPASHTQGSSSSGSSGSAVQIAADSVHSWVGIIMYLPTEVTAERKAITDSFRRYTHMVEDKLMPPYHASWHWAKIEPPEDPARLAAMKARLAERFPVAAFNAARAQLDPNNILANDMVDKLFGRPGAAGAATAAA